MNVTRRGRGVVVCVALLCMAWLLSGCGPRAVQAATPPPSVVGTWTMESVKGKAANLYQIGFAGNGTFKHTGKDALGKPASFQGVYQVGGSDQGPVIRLTYDDFPSGPTQWYFRIDADELVVAENPADLDSERALKFARVPEK